MSDRIPAILPSRRAVLERAAGFLENHLAVLRNRAREGDVYGYKQAESDVMDATETAYAAGVLRTLAEQEDQTRTRQVR